MTTDPKNEGAPAVGQEGLGEKPALAEILHEAGIRPETIDPEVLARLALLHEKTLTLADEYHALLMQKKLFDYYASGEHGRPYTTEEQEIIRVGTLFTDIGKTGPKEARRAIQECITEIFGIDDHVDPKTPVLEFLKTFFPSDYPHRIILLGEAGITPETTMRAFWNMHSRWTLEIVSESGVPPKAIPAAALHHMLEGVNPEDIVGSDERFTKYFGENLSFDRAEKMVILLDKYDASRRRGGKTHEQAVESLRLRLGDNARFRDDPEFTQLIGDIAVALKEQAGYAK